jgi:hypothetical protein
MLKQFALLALATVLAGSATAQAPEDKPTKKTEKKAEKKTYLPIIIKPADKDKGKKKSPEK